MQGRVRTIVAYILENKDWIFSGIGITIFAGSVALIRFAIKHLTLQFRLKNVSPQNVSDAIAKDAHWPFELVIAEPSQEFLLNCTIKSHATLLKKLKKAIGSLDTLIWLDMDRFTQINKYFGKECGDKIIHTVLMIIAAVVKEYNLSVKVFHADRRDEFYIIGQQLDEFTAKILISAIQRYEWSNLVPNLFVTCSAGIASYANSPVDTIKRARASLNLRKTKGGNGIGPMIDKLPLYSQVDLSNS